MSETPRSETARSETARSETARNGTAPGETPAAAAPLSSVPEEDNGLPLRAQLREDWQTHYRSLHDAGLHALVVHRLQVWVGRRQDPRLRPLGLALQAVNALLVKNVYGIEVYPTTVIGRRVLIGHHMAIILGRRAVIGDDCLIRQQVTLGQINDQEAEQPRIGRRVVLGAGCSLLGAVTVGDDAVIGPHALVVRDVPAGATAMSSPAKVLRLPTTPPPAPAP